MIRRIVIEKSARILRACADQEADRSYGVALGRNWAADKAVEGDEATPLGEFYVCSKNPRSKFFLSLCLSYPNAEDAERGLAAGLISREEYAQILSAWQLKRMPPQHTRLGGQIYIHGEDPARRDGAARDWTFGCIALQNSAMQDLYQRTALGTPVIIKD
ncbi:MAG TPA: L,D-transpeptidase [Steroidobacteraceae bacterium]|nr:L,D-transpeptidase [Steroidobacteraceae bacterium]